MYTFMCKIVLLTHIWYLMFYIGLLFSLLEKGVGTFLSLP